MIKKIIVVTIALLLVVSYSFAAEILTNADIVKMVKAGISNEIIITKIKTTDCNFKLTVDEILKLKDEGVPEEVLNEMIKKNTSQAETKNSNVEKQISSSIPMSNTQKNEKILLEAESKTELFSGNYKYLNATLDKAMKEKIEETPSWKMDAKYVQQQIKLAYSNSYNNPDYWLIYAKFCGLIEREDCVRKAFRKAHALSASSSKTSIIKGDTFFFLSKVTEDEISDEESDFSIVEDSLSPKIKYAQKAEKAYKESLKELNDKYLKTYVYYKLGLLYYEMFKDKSSAEEYLKKAGKSGTNSYWARKAEDKLKSGL